MSTTLRLYLMRHGETEWSRSGQHTGGSDIPLTPHGEEMSRNLRPMLAGLSFTQVLVSPRLRARQTCDGAGLSGSAHTEPDLAEWDYGDYESLRTVDIRKRRTGWDIWQDGCPGGESPREISQRADRLIDRLRKQEGRIALFSHGHFGRVLAARWIALPVAQGQHFLLSPATLSILSLSAAEPPQPAEQQIELWNSPSTLSL
jgi:broad specificity phosphatase PhoE